MFFYPQNVTRTAMNPAKNELSLPLPYFETTFMKRLLILVIFSPFLVAAQKQLVLTANVTGLKEGSGVSLIDINNPTDTLAKGVVRNGTFTIKKSLKETTLTSEL